MKTVSLDVHADASQVTVVSEEGEVVFEMRTATTREAMRAVVAGVPGPKRVVFEEGPLSGMLHDWLRELCEEVISCDPAHNALIACSEDSNDERDARRLAQLAQLGSIRRVYVPAEPYRTLRSLLKHDERLQGAVVSVKNRISGLSRRHGIGSGKAVYWRQARAGVLGRLPNGALKWQMESLYRQLDLLRRERLSAHRILGSWTKKLPVIKRLQSVPGIGPITARTLAGWIADPERFGNRQALSSYAGLGLGQGWTDWKPIGRARASKRGNRSIKRVMFLAAKAASRTDSALGKRYQARRQSGWGHDKAIRDLARTMLRCAWCLWKKGIDYDDGRVAALSGP